MSEVIRCPECDAENFAPAPSCSLCGSQLSPVARERGAEITDSGAPAPRQEGIMAEVDPLEASAPWQTSAQAGSRETGLAAVATAYTGNWCVPIVAILLLVHAVLWLATGDRGAMLVGLIAGYAFLGVVDFKEASWLARLNIWGHVFVATLALTLNWGAIEVLATLYLGFTLGSWFWACRKNDDRDASEVRRLEFEILPKRLIRLVLWGAIGVVGYSLDVDPQFRPWYIGGLVVCILLTFRVGVGSSGDHASGTSQRSRYIPKDVIGRVWLRDEGRCVECGSQEDIELDHIIPFSKGGSNTAKNLQLLCQGCNRSKSDNI